MKTKATPRPTQPWSFQHQFRACNNDGTCQHMNHDHYRSLPDNHRAEYIDYMAGMGYKPGYCGPHGVLFCSISPGICSSKHCPLRPKPNP